MISDSGSHNEKEEGRLPYAYVHCQYAGKKASKQEGTIRNDGIYSSMMQCRKCNAAFVNGIRSIKNQLSSQDERIY